MTREEAIKHKDIIIAFVNGEQIEYFRNNGWHNANTPNFNIDNEYRIKPKGKYVPFTYEDMNDTFIGEILKNITDPSFKAMIIAFDKNAIHIGNTHISSYKTVLKDWTFLDGSTFGKVEE